MNQPIFLTILQQSVDSQSLILILTLTLFILLLFWWAFKGEGDPDTRTSPFDEPDLVRDESHHHHHDDHHDSHDGYGETHVDVIATAVTVDEESDPEPVETVIVEATVEAEPAPVIIETVVEEERVPLQPDDLKKIEGIGPKIARILQEAGIYTFQQLAQTQVNTLEKIVREDAGIRVAFPDTWPEQAALAAEGDWDTLATLQDDLKGGRKA